MYSMIKWNTKRCLFRDKVYVLWNSGGIVGDVILQSYYTIFDSLLEENGFIYQCFIGIES